MKIKKFNQINEEFDINWEKDWKVIDLLFLLHKIGGGVDNYREHPVAEEWDYYREERLKRNDTGCLEWVGEDENTPLINKFLLEQGYEKGSKIIYWVSW